MAHLALAELDSSTEFTPVRAGSSRRAAASLDPQDEIDLVAAVIAEERGAWARFQVQYERLIIACVKKTVACYRERLLSEDEADLVASVWLDLIRNSYGKLRKFDPQRARLSSWVGLIAANVAIDALRRLRPEAVALEDEVPAHVPTMAAVPNPLAQYEAAEQAFLVARARARLTADEQRFLTAVLDDDDPDPVAIAAAFAVEVATVYSRKNKLIAKLRVIVAQIVAG